MQVKWKCLLKRILLPIIITIIAAIIMMGIMIVGAWVYYTYINTDYISQPQYYVYDRNAEIGRSIAMFSMPFLFVLLIVFIISWMREAVKPCIIKEDTYIDTIAWGFGAFIGFIQFLACVLFFIMGVIMLFPCASVIMSILTGRYSDIPIGIFAYILTTIMFFISWFIYPYRQNDIIQKLIKDDVK